MSVPRPVSRTWWIVGLGLLMIGWAYYLRNYGPRGTGGLLEVPSLKTSRPEYRADFDWTLRDLEGRTISFETFRGRPIFLNLWATWCGPCLSELPAIERLASNPRLKKVAFLAVSTEDLETLQGFNASRPLRVPVFQSPTDPPAIFQSPGIPATYLIAPDGRIATAQIGSAQWDDPSVVDFLEKLSANP